MPNPFDDIHSLILGIQKQNTPTVFDGPYGRLNQIADWYKGHSKSSGHGIQKPLLVIFAGNHSIAAQEFTTNIRMPTRTIIDDIGNGDAFINQVCQVNGVGLQVFELALDNPIADITKFPALNEAEWAATFAYGMESLASEPDLLAIGSVSDCGILSAAAIFLALYGGKAEKYLPKFLCDSEEMYKLRCEAIEQAVALHAHSCTNPLHILQHFGGREMTAMAGAIIAARYQKTPVILDGFISTAVAAVIHAVSAHAIDHCQFGHESPWEAHQHVNSMLGIEPLLKLAITNDIGVGAASSISLIKSAHAMVVFNGFEY